MRIAQSVVALDCCSDDGAVRGELYKGSDAVPLDVGQLRRNGCTPLGAGRKVERPHELQQPEHLPPTGDAQQ